MQARPGLARRSSPSLCDARHEFAATPRLATPVRPNYNRNDMNIYQVGGSVRDLLMGKTPEDKDYVVIGGTVQQMLALGYTQVGADFPVFLHPQTHDEYALGRIERKTAGGYHGFAISTENVTLEEDLSRRDLTINAMAMDEQGQLIDPYSGHADLKQKLLRHVGPAFAEDPVRILRVLRFRARFGPDWQIAPETWALLTAMVQSGEADHLVAERIWKERSRALLEPHAELFCEGLAQLSLLERPAFFELRHALHSELVSFAEEAFRGARLTNASLTGRFCLAFATLAPAGYFANPGMAPKEVRRAAQALTEVMPAFVSEMEPYGQRSPAARLDVLHRMGALNTQREQYDSVRQALGCWQTASGRSSQLMADLDRDVERARAVDTKAITQSMPPGPAVGAAIQAARTAALA